MNPFRAASAASRFVLAAALGRPQLLGVGWSITHACNSRCPFCDRHSGSKGVDTKTALELVDELAAAGCRRVHLTGGEPLVRRDLATILGRIRDRGLVSTVNTNGSLLVEREDVVKACDAFLISVDGPREIHDRYRGEGHFARAERGLALLERHEKPFVFSVTLLRQNLDQMDFFLDLARRHRTRIVLQPGATHVLGSRAANPEAPDVVVYRRVLRDLLNDPKQRRWVWNSQPGLEQLARWPEQHRLKTHAGRITCRLEVDGHLYPCSRSVLDPSCNPAPNVLDLGVEEAFRRLPRIDCSEHVCQCAHNIEKNLLFGWNVSAWYSYFARNYVERRRAAA